MEKETQKTESPISPITEFNGIDGKPAVVCRSPLPLSKIVRPGESAQIVARPQRIAFRPERLFVSGHGAGDEAALPWWKVPLKPWRRVRIGAGAADWIINDLMIGNRSQFAQAGELPGDMFANSAIDSFITFDTAQTAMDVTLVVTYIGPFKKGIPFIGASIGIEARY